MPTWPNSEAPEQTAIPKLENSKCETNSKYKIRMIETSWSMRHDFLRRRATPFLAFEFRIWDLFRISCFGFRIFEDAGPGYRSDG
jgi:hypothetical protein